jgi:hypothetical protein
MMLPEIVVRESRIHGRGLFATREIPCGTVVWFPCRRCDRWSAAEIQGLPEARVQWLDEYGYRLSDGGILLPCSNAHLMNHSCKARVLDFGLDFGVAVRDIHAEEEVTCDFRTFTADPAWSLTCRCRASGCAGRLTPQGGLNLHLQREWSRRVEEALVRLPRTPQPMHEELLASSTVYRQIRFGESALPAARGASILCPTFLSGLAEFRTVFMPMTGNLR